MLAGTEIAWVKSPLAAYIIHVNGPKFREVDEEGKLRAAMKNALRRADEKGIKQLIEAGTVAESAEAVAAWLLS